MFWIQDCVRIECKSFFQSSNYFFGVTVFSVFITVFLEISSSKRWSTAINNILGHIFCHSQRHFFSFLSYFYIDTASFLLMLWADIDVPCCILAVANLQGGKGSRDVSVGDQI